MLATTLRELAGLRLTDQDGKQHVLKLQPPATEAELRRVESALPCPLPDDVREALRVSKGLANGPLEAFSLLELEGFGLDEAFPNVYSIAHDRFGNYWVLDLLPDTTVWGPVFYACHDPPVIAYQAAKVEEFLRDTVAMWQAGARSPVDMVHEEGVHRIWRENPGLEPAAGLRASPDPVLREFAGSLADEALVIDLREAGLGDGFNWGRFGPRTIIERAGRERVWALTPPERRPGLLARLFGGARREGTA
jgi:cell wall assembly regulator SMI1